MNESGEKRTGAWASLESALLLVLVLFKFTYVLLIPRIAGVSWPQGLTEPPPQSTEKAFEYLSMTAPSGPFAAHNGRCYLQLSRWGYARGEVVDCFYPLYPLLIRATAPLFGGNHVVSGVVLSNVFSLAGWFLFLRLTARRWGLRAALWSLGFLIAFPGSLFFQFIYTESLFFLLLMGLWWGLQNRRLALAAVCGTLAPLCRGPGAFLLLPLAGHAFETTFPSGLSAWVARPRQGRRPSSFPHSSGPATATAENQPSQASGGQQKAEPARGKPDRLRPGAVWLVAGTPVLGFGIYLALMWHWTGNAFEGIDAQHRWGDHAISNIWNIPKFIAAFFTPATWYDRNATVLDRLVFLLIVSTLPVLWRQDKSLAVWTVALGILPAMSGTFTALTRYASCAFPMFVALGLVINRRPRPWAGAGLLAVFGLLHAVLLWRHVHFLWAG